MADEARAPDPRTPPPPRDPKRRNLRVSGAPQKTPMIPWKPGRFIAIVIGLFILNWVIVGIVAPQEKRIQIPYNPTFLNEVRAGNVKAPGLYDRDWNRDRQLCEGTGIKYAYLPHGDDYMARPPVTVTLVPKLSSGCPPMEDLTHLNQVSTATAKLFNIYPKKGCVVEGAGESQIGNQTIRWKQRDIFTLPQGNRILHRSIGGSARLFQVSDRDIYARLGLLKEEYGNIAA